jgi:hypothetical protein
MGNIVPNHWLLAGYLTDAGHDDSEFRKAAFIP